MLHKPVHFRGMSINFPAIAQGELPEVTPLLIRRMEACVASQQEVGMQALKACPENPERADFLKVPGATAFVTGSAKGAHLMNHICVVGHEWANSAEVLLKLYNLQDVTPRIMVPDMHLSSVKEFTEDGYRVELIQKEVRFCGKPLKFAPALSEGVTVKKVANRDDMDVWLELFSEAFEGRVRKRDDADAQGPDWDRWRAYHSAGDRRHYLALLHGQPAAQAGMYCHDGIAYMGPAATLPIFRNLGLHAVLLLQRMYDAHLAGCDLVISGAEPGTVSAKNQERHGLRPMYIRHMLKIQKKP